MGAGRGGKSFGFRNWVSALSDESGSGDQLLSDAAIIMRGYALRAEVTSSTCNE